MAGRGRSLVRVCVTGRTSKMAEAKGREEGLRVSSVGTSAEARGGADLTPAPSSHPSTRVGCVLHEGTQENERCAHGGKGKGKEGGWSATLPLRRNLLPESLDPRIRGGALVRGAASRLRPRRWVSIPVRAEVELQGAVGRCGAQDVEPRALVMRSSRPAGAEWGELRTCGGGGAAEGCGLEGGCWAWSTVSSALCEAMTERCAQMARAARGPRTLRGSRVRRATALERSEPCPTRAFATPLRPVGRLPGSAPTCDRRFPAATLARAEAARGIGPLPGLAHFDPAVPPAETRACCLLSFTSLGTAALAPRAVAHPHGQTGSAPINARREIEAGKS